MFAMRLKRLNLIALLKIAVDAPAFASQLLERVNQACSSALLYSLMISMDMIAKRGPSK